MNYIIELINKIGDAIPCQLILQFVDEDWESSLGEVPQLKKELG